MLRLLTDEDFNGDILARLRQARPKLDIVRIQDVGLRTKDDILILEWAARENRVVLSHDVRTLKDHAYDRVRVGLSMPGVIIVSKQISLRQATAEIIMMIECSFDDEFENHVQYIPV